MIYGFYSKNDITREIIFRHKFESLTAAIQFFTHLKRLTPYEFSLLYNVTVIKETYDKRDGTD
jgi:hypothetical protein